MSILERTTAPRNGLPERRNYAYRGTGTDTLTGHLGTAALEPYRGDYAQHDTAAAMAAEPERPATAERCEVCGYLLTAPGHLLSCGTPDARRIMRLAGAIGARPCGS